MVMDGVQLERHGHRWSEQEQEQEQRQEWPVLLQAQGLLLRSKWRHHNP
jgi:hypothetical protein